LQVRLRFFLVLIVAFVVVGKWDVLRNYWDRLTRRGGGNTTYPVSTDTEYFCPMCPGVLSDWPSKCPVCNMALVRRKKGDAVPLPDGVVARMQFSPYRLQLAGIQTSPVAYQPLVREVVLVGFVEADDRRPQRADRDQVYVKADIYDKDLPFLTEGQSIEVSADAFPGRAPFTGRVRALTAQVTAENRALQAWLEIDNPRQELRPAMMVTVRVKVPVVRLEPFTKTLVEEWQNRTAVDLAMYAVFAGAPGGGIEPLARAAGQQALLRGGLALAVPESAVVDTGLRRVVYVETGPGMFDGVEVVLGPRCEAFYPVIRGLEAGQRVATAGAFLIDAETRLNPSIAASYFGAARSSEPERGTPSPTRADDSLQKALSRLPPADQALAARQRLCPVTDQPLGSMGTPVSAVVGGKTVFLCCKGCEQELKDNPEKYLSKLPLP
jgi:hypothetical protein